MAKLWTPQVNDVVYEWSPKTCGKIIAIKRDPEGHPGFDICEVKWQNGKKTKHRAYSLHSYKTKIRSALDLIRNYRNKIIIGETIA